MIAALPSGDRQRIATEIGASFRYLYLAGAIIAAIGIALAFFLKELPLKSAERR